MAKSCGGGPVLCSACGKLRDEKRSVPRSRVRFVSGTPRVNESKWVCDRCVDRFGGVYQRPLSEAFDACNTGDMPAKIRPVASPAPQIRVARPGEAWDAGQRPAKGTLATVVLPDGREVDRALVVAALRKRILARRTVDPRVADNLRALLRQKRMRGYLNNCVRLRNGEMV